MSILIKGMEFPDTDVTLVISSDGSCRITGMVSDVNPDTKVWIPIFEMHEAVEVPTHHGRLIDEKTLLNYLWGVVQNCRQGMHMPFLTFATVQSVAEDTPTIIEAEE